MGKLIVDRRGPVLTLELSNPGKANALDLDMLAQLDEQVRKAGEDSTVRVVLLRGTAGGPFSAGADIRQWGAMTPDAFADDWIAHGNEIFRRFEQLRCPTLAVIEGLCLGGALELALCADLRVASHAALLLFPELTIGAIPGWEGGTRLARIAGRGRALEAVLTAREIDAATALHWGVFNAVWPHDDMLLQLDALIDRLCRVSPQAATLAKHAIVGDDDPLTFYPAAARVIKASADAATGIRAFLDKKAASF
jgi:enoyl-CoA hydratase